MIIIFASNLQNSKNQQQHYNLCSTAMSSNSIRKFVVKYLKFYTAKMRTEPPNAHQLSFYYNYAYATSLRILRLIWKIKCYTQTKMFVFC